jgi:hypothetical protein
LTTSDPFTVTCAEALAHTVLAEAVTVEIRPADAAKPATMVARAAIFFMVDPVPFLVVWLVPPQGQDAAAADS